MSVQVLESPRTTHESSRSSESVKRLLQSSTATNVVGRPFRVVSLLSGGIDSSTLLYWLKHQGYEVKALTIIYGQRHEREIYAARKIAYEADVEWRLIDISGVRLVLRSALTSEDIPIPEVPEDAQYYDCLLYTSPSPRDRG